MSRARWAIVAMTAEKVIIQDLGGAMSVTNDAETVVKELLQKWGGSRRIFYWDSEKNLDELCHDGSKFTHFAPGPQRRVKEKVHGRS